MSVNKRTQKEIRRLNSIERQLSTWKKASAKNPKFEQKYRDIMVLADENGMLTPTGKLSKSKRTYANMEKFYLQYKTMSGSVHKFTQREKKKWRTENILLLDRGVETLTFNEYEKLSNNLNNVISELYLNYPSDNAYDFMQLHIEEDKSTLIESIETFMADNPTQELIPIEKFESRYN